MKNGNEEAAASPALNPTAGTGIINGASAEPSLASSEAEKASLPTLFRDPSFFGASVAQFLGAFNDNVMKQLTLLVCLQETSSDRQALATAVFAAPFLLFSGVAGFLADRVSKTMVFRGCKAAEVLIQSLGLWAAAMVLIRGGLLYPPLLIVLFFMGAHSAIFGPSKYGILSELFRRPDLPQANGVFLTSTFVAIILGWVVAGLLFEAGQGSMPQGVVWGTSAGLLIAAAGLAGSLLIRRTPPAKPDLAFGAQHIAIDPASWRMIFSDKRLLGAMVVNGVFYFCGGMMQPAVNAFGLSQLLLTEKVTGLLLGCIALGIAVGCLLAGQLCQGRADFRIAKFGAGLSSAAVLSLGLFGFVGNTGGVLPSLAAATALFLVGFGGGLLAVPLSVAIQSRAPAERKGRVLAASSCFNWIGVLCSAAFYAAAVKLRDGLDWPASAMFPLMAAPLIISAILLPGHRDAAEPVSNQASPINIDNPRDT